jgi:hypothetical protein
LEYVIDNIQVKPIELVELVVLIIEFKQPIVVATKTSQLVQLIVEPIQIINP